MLMSQLCSKHPCSPVWRLITAGPLACQSASPRRRPPGAWSRAISLNVASHATRTRKKEVRKKKKDQRSRTRVESACVVLSFFFFVFLTAFLSPSSLGKKRRPNSVYYSPRLAHPTCVCCVSLILFFFWAVRHATYTHSYPPQALGSAALFSFFDQPGK